MLHVLTPQALAGHRRYVQFGMTGRSTNEEAETLASADQRPASVAIPQLAGGGAEKMTRNLSRLLGDEGSLSRVYTGSLAGSDRWGSAEFVAIGAPSALASARLFARALRGDAAATLLLTLGYVNLAPIVRYVLPGTRVVVLVRIGNTLTPELMTLGRIRRLCYLASLWLSLAVQNKATVASMEKPRPFE